MGEVEVRKTLKKLGHLLAAKLASMPAGSHGAEIIVCPPHEIAISLQPLDRGPWAFPPEEVTEPGLNPTEKAILAACSKTQPRKGLVISRRAGLDYGSHVRECLSKLVEKGKLKKTAGGYLLI